MARPPRTPPPAAWLAALALVLTCAGAAAQRDPTTRRGPYAVGQADWAFGQVAVKVPGSPDETMLVEHFGTLRYPALTAGTNAPAATDGPFPLVVFAHGRYQVAPYVGANHTQASYLIDHLASWGFVVASVNLDVVGQYATPPAIFQRGQLIVATIDAFAKLDPGGLVVDRTRIGLVGHSRGGEGCLSAYKQLPAGTISAIATIAATDFGEHAIEGVPYLGLYGSKDGDVSNGWPIWIWDDMSGERKAFEYVEGANHFWFTDGITYFGEGSADITREQHHDVARAYIAYFLDAILGGHPGRLAELCDGEAMSAVTDVLLLHPMYSDPAALVVDDFEDEPANPDANSLGGLVAWSHMLLSGEESLDDPAQTFYHRTRAARIGYDTGGLATPLHVMTIPGGADVSGYGAVSLRVLQRWNAGKNQAYEAQDLRIGLLDGSGHTAVRKLSHYGTIPWPKTHTGTAFPKKSVLRTTRIPLSEFLLSNPALDLTDIRFVGLLFDQKPSAELRIDDVEFTP